MPVDEEYDLVGGGGGGISGLSAAYLYREKHGADKKILVLGYGGTESIDSPRTGYSEVAAALLKTLAIDVDRFTSAFDRAFYYNHKLSRGVFFDRDNWGQDKLVTGDPFWMADDDQLPTKLNDRAVKDFIADFPLSDEDKAALVKFHENPGDYLAGKSIEEKEAHLSTTSYRDYLLNDAKLSEAAAKYFQGRFNDLYAGSSDTVSAASAMGSGFPGLRRS